MEEVHRSVRHRAQVTNAGLFLAVGAKRVQFNAPTSSTEVPTRGAIHRFHHIPTDTLFREEQRSPGVPWEG